MKKISLLKFIAIILAIGMLLSITGCGKRETVISYYEDVPVDIASDTEKAESNKDSSSDKDASTVSSNKSDSSFDLQSQPSNTPSNTQNPGKTETVKFDFSRKEFVGIDPSDKTGAVISDVEWNHYKELGIKWIRVMLNYDTVGKSETDPDYLLLDEFVKRANKEGISILMCLSYEAAPSLPKVKNGDKTVYDKPAETLINISRLAIKHFIKLGVQHYEVWHQPNSFHVTPIDYAEMISGIYEKCKYTENWTGGKEITIIGLSLGLWGYDENSKPSAYDYLAEVYASYAYKTFKNKYGHSPWDAVSFHPYDTVTVDANGKITKNILRTVINEHMLKQMKANGDGNLPVWFTMWGLNEKDDAIHGNTIYAMMKEAAKLEQVQTMIFYKYNYGGEHYGLFKDDNKRPAFALLQKAIKEIGKG